MTAAAREPNARSDVVLSAQGDHRHIGQLFEDELAGF
jgi:hypothetical protein